MAKKINGLSSEAVLHSKEKHGDNSLEKEKTKSFIRKFFENLNDPIIKVLITALIAEIVFTFGKCNFFEIFGIVAAILIATTVSTVSEFGSERAFRKMQAESLESHVKVMRDGKIMEIPSNELVVGDIVYLTAGERIQADGIIISGVIKVDQSALNGESAEVLKECGQNAASWSLENKNQIFRGSNVVSGEAVMEVFRVGAKTFYGMVAKDVQTETRESPLKIRLAKFASQISKIGYVMAAIVAVTYLFNTFISDNGFVGEKILKSLKNFPFLVTTLTHALTLMITVIVVAAPEGLPMMITVVLSANMKKMMRDGVLVKKLVGIETAGSMNILFTDKTGTLTTGKLECEKIICESGNYKNMSQLKKNPKVYKYMGLCARYNSDSIYSDGKIIGGNGTDRAIGEFFKNEKIAEVSVKEKIQFTSERKYSAVKLSDGEVIIKGAPEILFSKAKYSVSEKGELLPFDKSRFMREYLNEAGLGNRGIAVAYKKSDSGDIIFVSLVILKDKLRQGVKESVRQVKRAGIQVVMLTGDNPETASKIAEECGIMNGNSEEIVLTSSELSSMSDGEIADILPRLRVLARALPQDKTRLVKISQSLDLVVGMTGDGINDAPSLKLSDVGFSMGSGTDIAKSAGDVVLLDNSFYSISRTVLYGRTIFKSIRKFIIFQLIMNLAACGVSLVGQFMGIDSPITIIQMLWVNIIMDTLGGLAFAGEPPLDEYMKEKPKERSESILSGEMVNQIVFTGLYTLGLCIVFLCSNLFRNSFREMGGSICYMSAFYALFIFSGIFNCFGARTERLWLLSNIRRNKPFVLIMIFISVIQVCMIYYGGSIFRTVPLTAQEFLTVILLAFSVIPFEFVRKIFSKLRKR
jgi:calcium-translocating P-type ATPase